MLPFGKDKVVAELQNTYIMTGVWATVNDNDKMKYANTLNSTLQILPWKKGSNPFETAEAATSIEGVYAFLLKKTADTGGNVDFVFDEDDNAAHMLNPYLTRRRDETGPSMIASIEYV